MIRQAELLLIRKSEMACESSAGIRMAKTLTEHYLALQGKTQDLDHGPKYTNTGRTRYHKQPGTDNGSSYSLMGALLVISCYPYSFRLGLPDNGNSTVHCWCFNYIPSLCSLGLHLPNVLCHLFLAYEYLRPHAYTLYTRPVGRI